MAINRNLSILAQGAGSNQTLTLTNAQANALTVGRQGTTNPVLNVDASTASVVTGLNLKGAAAAGGMALSVTSSGTNENLTIDAKGSGTVTINGTATGGITLTRAVTMSSTATATAFIPSSSSVPTNGLYLPAANTVGFAINSAEKGRFGSDGSLLVGTTTNGGWAGNAIGEFNTSVQGASFYNTANGSNNCAALFRTDFDASPLLRFYKGTAAAGQFISTGGATPNIQWLANNEAYVFSGGSGGVKLTSGATAWASASDETLKTDLAAIQSGAEKVASLRAVTGRYKTDPEGTSRSFLIAQDVKAVLPEAVSEDADGVLSLRYTEVIPLLVAAIKELNARLATVEGKVN